MHNHPLFGEPALFLAPLAGLTHAPFRRLLSEFGGYSALYSEMLAATPLLQQNLHASPFTNRREEEGKVVYQLQVNSDDHIEKIVKRLRSEIKPWALDLNLGCPAPSARKKRTGAALFELPTEIDEVLQRIRAEWDGPLSVKCRLGSRKRKEWFQHFTQTLATFEKAELSWLTVHARFWEDGRKRLTQTEQYARICEHTSIPLIGNGEILSKEQLTHPNYHCLSGAMIGRMAIVRPWIFREIADPHFDSSSIDFAKVWERLCSYVLEEFREERAVGRMKQFTSYYCQNFKFGHSLYAKIQNLKKIDEMKDVTLDFLRRDPERVKSIKILEL